MFNCPVISPEVPFIILPFNVPVIEALPPTVKFSFIVKFLVEIKLLFVILSDLIVVKLQVEPDNILPVKFVKLPVFEVKVPDIEAFFSIFTVSHLRSTEVFTIKVSNSRSLKVIWSPLNSIPSVTVKVSKVAIPPETLFAIVKLPEASKVSKLVLPLFIFNCPLLFNSNKFFLLESFSPTPITNAPLATALLYLPNIIS